jgi:excinuclease UvrABC nuclease subunit
MRAVWRPCLREIPQRPGVYRFSDARGATLYIGKALRLRRRIASYFHPRRRQPRRLRRMLARAREVSLQETGSELEALLLESRLLKRDKPPFNRLSTDYAAPPFVELTLGEPFPRLKLTRQLGADGSHFLGPFPRFQVAAAVLAALQRLFLLRTCDVAVVPGVSPQPCEAFHLRKCIAPCLGPHLRSTYSWEVEALLALLAGGHEAILQRLDEERQRAAEALFFERAGHLHSLHTAFLAATTGRPLTLLPVAWRNLLAIFAGDAPPTREVFYIRRGLFVGRVVLSGGAGDRHTLADLLNRVPGVEHPDSRGSEAVVDEVRLVAGWLQRTRTQARWLFVEPQGSAAEALAAVMQAMPPP